MKALFIDGPNLYAAAKQLAIDIDFRKLRDVFKDGLIRAYYYTAIKPNEEYISIQPLVDYLSYNGYSVVSKKAKVFVDSDGREKIKGNMDTEISVDAFELTVNGAINEAVFFTGDGDFSYLLCALQRRGVHCTVVSSIITRPPICADELRRVADHFVDLSDLKDQVMRDAANRPPRRNYG